MNPPMLKCNLIFAAVASLALTARAEEAAQDLSKLLNVKPGSTVTLPAGTFRGGVTIPAGVRLQGAGYGKTIIDAAGLPNGITVSGDKATTISNLTVRGATGANILVQGAADASIRKVRAVGGLIGISCQDSKSCRIENSICDGNRYGLVVTGGEHNVVVDCTVAGNASLGMSFPSGKGTVAFNNCVTDSATAVLVGEEAQDLMLDHNLYLGLNIGKFGAEIARETLNNWQYLSRQDAHSVNIPVKYEDPASGRYAVVNTLDWALDRTANAGWGTSKLAGRQAPTNDIDGKLRAAAPCVGAFESTATAPRPPDGTLRVSAGIGLTSAGVFDSKGRLLSYLFQGLPLVVGEHLFWLPSRSYKGRNVEAGEYEVRVLESKMNWEYLGWIANTDTSDEAAASCAVNPRATAFDQAGRLISGRGISEATDNLRAFDAATGKWLWVFKGGAHMYGLTVPSDGLVYALRRAHDKETRLTRIDPSNGKIAPWGETDYGQYVFKDGKTFNGLTSLGEKLWYSDGANNLMWAATVQSPEPTTSFKVASPSSPSADTKTNVVWAISNGDKLVAISPEGKIVAEHQAVQQPLALAARDGRLAVASKQTGKVHLFDSSDPTKLKPLNTVGRGDGPDGRILPDRFVFQDGASEVCLALGPKHELAVGEEMARFQVFDRDGKVAWSSFSTGGWAITTSKLTPGRIFASGFTMMADSRQKKWWPESFHRALRGWVIGECQVEGQTFAVINDGQNGISFVNFTPDKATPAIGIMCPWGSKEPWTYRTDSNGDKLINAADAAVATVTDPKGQPVAGRRLFSQGSNTIWPNGEITYGSNEGWLNRWPCAGLDEYGRPKYRYEDRTIVSSAKSDLVPPYDPKSQGGGTAEHTQRPGGGWTFLSGFHAAPSIRHTLLPGGTDLVGVDRDGVVDWIHTFGQYPGNPKIGSLDAGDGFSIASLAASYDYFIVNPDGLTMQGFSMPKRAHFIGHWVDHPDTVSTFIDAAGQTNLLTCDYMSNRNHWFVLREKQVVETKSKLPVQPELAAQLAALPAPKLDVNAGKPATPIVRIAKLKSPLTIDGDLQKWRDAGLAPQIIITPEASMGIEGGPRDCSALVRLAYHGQDLYVQILRFDDVVAAHQPRSRAYQQDSAEVCVNGIMEGIKFNLANTTDAGPVNQIDGWNLKAHALDHKDSPLVVKWLENAEAVTERQTIENIYGVSMRDCKVQLFETKVPMDAKTYAGRPEARFDLKPKQEFWLGFLINDNDQPGTDVQNFLTWPVTYGTFSAKESGAIGVFE